MAHALALTLGAPKGSAASDLHIMANMYTEPLRFDLPPLPRRCWHRAIDTALPSPQDIAEAGSEQPIEGEHYWLRERSIVALLTR